MTWGNMNPSRSVSTDAGNKETTMTTLQIMRLDLTGFDVTGHEITSLEITGHEISGQSATGATR
jgi:hypothetical protein